MSSNESESDTISSFDFSRIAFCSRSELLNELKTLKLTKKKKHHRKFYNEDFPEHDKILDTIEYESVAKVEEALMETKLSTKRELEGTGIMIYQKASERTDLSLKYAQLVKKLQDVEVTEDGDTQIFKAGFDSHFLNFINNVMTMNELMANPGISIKSKRKDNTKAVGLFIGNLYNVNYYTLARVIQIAKLIKEKKGPKNKMLLEHVLTTMSVRLSHENIKMDVINNMLGRYDPDNNANKNLNPDSDAIANFCAFLADIKENKFKFYDGYESFEKIAEESHEIKIGCLIQDAFTNEESLNVYRDVALNIHNYRPELLQLQLKEEFNKVIAKFDAKKQKFDLENVNKFSHVGNMIVEFYTAGLIEDDLVETYLNALKGSKMPKKIFRWIFLQVLKRYEGSKLTDYFQYFQSICIEMPEFRSNITMVKEYLQNRGTRKIITSKREKILETGAAAQPDLQEFFAKRAKHDATFKCNKISSCHFAGLRSLDILTSHIGSKFFNKTTIDICVKLSKNMLDIPSEAKIGENLEREMKLYFPYFLNDLEPELKVSNFSNLLISFYDDGLLKYKIISKWMDQIYDVVKTQKHTFHKNYMDIYVSTFKRISKNLMRDDPNSWLIHSNFVDSCEFESSKFTDFKKFKELIERFEKCSEFTSVNELKKLVIPNDKIAIKQISKFVIDFYINEKPSALLIASVFTVLADKYTPKLDKNLLQSEFQNAMCLKIGYICARDSALTSKVHQDGQLTIELIREMFMKTHITQLGLATFLITMSEMLVKYPIPVRELISLATIKWNEFFISANPISPQVQRTLKELGRAIVKASDEDPKEFMKTKDILQIIKEILDDSEQKRKIIEQEQWNKLSISTPSPRSLIKNVRLPNKIRTINEIEMKKENLISSSRSSSTSSMSNEASSKTSDTPSSIEQNLENSTNEITKLIRTSEPKILFENITEFKDFCEYFDNLEPKTSKDDEQIFDSNFVSTIKFTKKEQILSFSRKFIDRVLANKAPIIFFVQNAIKIGNFLQTPSKKTENLTFRKTLIDEILSIFSGEKILVEFMCELYNNNFISKTTMIVFVEKFKTQDPKNLILLQIFIRICGLKLANQGDKQQLIQIRTITRSFKGSVDVDENLRFIAQDLSNSLNSVISLMEKVQGIEKNVTINDLNESMNDEEFNAVLNFIKNSNETPEKIADDLITKSLINPQISVIAARKFDGRVKHFIIQKIQNLLKDVPEISISAAEFRNLIEFLANLYNVDILRNEFLNWCIEIFLKTTTEEVSCECLAIIFETCGSKMEKSNKLKLDVYLKFFETVLASNEGSIRCDYFKRITVLKARNWKSIHISENYFEDFLMLYSINDANIDELVEIFKLNDEEMEKFIQILWKVILKEAPHPSYSILCEEIFKSCENFHSMLIKFLTERWKIFINLDDEFFNENVKQRLGKVIIFVAQTYNRNLLTDDILEMWIDIKLTLKTLPEFIQIIFSILGSCKRLENNRNIRLMSLAKNIENIYFEEMEERVSVIISDLNVLNKNSLK
ncbi:uncharacterized protein [Chironomus tepperi]|uniref:uncharacterized protein n=1 Tax=Chironomus tepperi TaxID=113505 RepID=UPI00391F2559